MVISSCSERGPGEETWNITSEKEGPKEKPINESRGNKEISQIDREAKRKLAE